MIDLYPAYKPFRNYMRRFALVPSLLQLWAYYLHVVDGKPLPPDFAATKPTSLSLRTHLHPWDLEILVREVILNAGKNGDNDLRDWRELATAVNHIRRLEGTPYEQEDDPPNVLVDLHRMSHRQFKWQSGVPAGAHIIRAMKIFGDEALDTKVLGAIGIHMNQLLRLGMAIAGGFKNRPSLSISTDFSSIGIGPGASRPLLERLTCDARTLRERIKECQHYDDAWLYAKNPLEQYPLIRIDASHPDHVLCPVPLFLLTRITAGVFYDIVNTDGFAKPYGESFQTYVGQVIGRTLASPDFRIMEERPYTETKAKLKHGTDWIVSDSSGHLFFECKTKRLSIGAKNATDSLAVEKDLAAMSRAIVQNYKNILDAKKGLTTSQPDDLQIFPVIVTLEDWYLYSTHFTSRLREDVRELLALESIDDAIIHEMPYSVASVAELERALQVVAGSGIATVFAKKSSEAFQDWGLLTFLHNHFPQELRGTKALLFPDDAQRLFPEFDTREF